MKPDVVVDIGNTRVKWGRCSDAGVSHVIAIGHTIPAWDGQIHEWRSDLPRHCHWAVAGVVPISIDRFREWASGRGDRVTVVSACEQIPIPLDIQCPETVGLDRLLGAVAARSLFPGKRILVVDAGSAVTMNLVDDAFRGGAIFPGLRLLGEALHAHTARLPKVLLDKVESYPGRNTEAAIRAGLCSVMAGAVEHCARQCEPEAIVLTGGDGALLESMVTWAVKRYEPALNLVGLWRTVDLMP